MVLGLNRAKAAAEAAPCVDTKPPMVPIDASLVAKAPMTLKVQATTGMSMTSSTTTAIDESGTVLFNVKTDKPMMGAPKQVYTKADGSEICTVDMQGGMMTAYKAIILKAGKEVAVIEITKAMLPPSCSGIYKVGGTDVYKGEKYLTLKFFMTVCLPDGTTMVGKANQTGLDPKYQEITVGTGVDLVASFILSSAIGLASGSGGAAAGALAGSGAA